MRIATHPTLGILVREDGLVLVPENFRNPAHWTYGTPIGKAGYLTVRISKKPYYVHRLVAETFIENPDSLPEIDHKDRNPANNHYTNLRWADRSIQLANRKITEDSVSKYGVRSCTDTPAYKRSYYEKNKEAVSASHKKYRESHREQAKKTSREWYRANKESADRKATLYAERKRAEGFIRKRVDGHRVWVKVCTDADARIRTENEA